jgi:alpha-glucuronidase
VKTKDRFHGFPFVSRILCPAVVALVACVSAPVAHAEDGYRLWLRYDPLPAGKAETYYRSHITSVVVTGNSATQVAIRKELVEAFSGLLGQPVSATNQVSGSGAVIVGTPKSSPIIAGMKLDQPLAALGPEGFLIRSVRSGAIQATVIASASDTGALYGAFHFLRLVQTLQPIDALNVSEKPAFKLRVLDHWDNLDGSIERGYAGRSLWNWSELPDTVDPRLTDYARADASIGINGAVLNNVNASADSLNPEYLKKTAAIADAFRPYGVRVYLVPRFSSPMELGGLSTADPLDPKVIAWWKAKADEIYKLIPDFGGFLVKANSEGQPGPVTYHRTHADGANMLAAALAPHGGVVMWRAFVYDSKPGSDRIGQAYDALKPFDGKFAPNVFLQVKNGPLDFQPREPFHPLFGGMPRTQVMPELQITQEYLGHSNHLAFLAPLWREFLDSDTFAKGPGSTVAKVVDGSVFGQKLTGIAGVANIGSDRDWTGHLMGQANWFAFGRLAWNPNLSAKTIAQEWVAMTFTRDPVVVAEITRILLESREAVVSYMTPLGLAHIMLHDNHYGPQPWDESGWREDWRPPYYHRAAADGIGFERTAKGSNAVSQYAAPVRDRFANLAKCPDELLLWFHHVPWDYKMRSGRTLWDELCLRYQRGVDWTVKTRKDWAALAGKIDPERHAAVAEKLAIQSHDAKWWRDACLLYFQTFSKRPFPAGMPKPTRTLDQVKALDANGHPPGGEAEDSETDEPVADTPPQADARPLPPNLKILPLGDSITFGYPGSNGGYRGPLYELLAPVASNFAFVGSSTEKWGVTTLPARQWHHEGHGSYAIDDVLHNLNGLDDKVFRQYGEANRDPHGGHWLDGIASGPNARPPLRPDIILLLIGTNDRDNPNGAKRRLDALVGKLVTLRPDAKLIIARIPPEMDTEAHGRFVAEFNQGVDDVVKSYAGRGKHVFLADLNTGFPADGLSPDKLHPSDTGYNWMAQRWYEAIVKSEVL